MANTNFKIARITAAHGIRGEVKLACFLENPKDILLHNPLKTKQGKAYRLTITGSAKDQLIAKIEGITTRNEAEGLRGVELFGEAKALPLLAENEFYHADLVGLTAILASGEVVGKVAAVHNFGAGDILEIVGEKGELLLPFKAPFVGDITPPRLTITLPEYIGDKE